MSKLDFYMDLSVSCSESAEFLRKKHRDWNKEKSDREKIFSGEREFVSDVYHLLVKKNPEYRNYLLVDYMRPGERENDEGAVPDLVLRNDHNDSVVEIKAIVNRRKDGSPEPLSSDLESIQGDHEQLLNHYKLFKTKIQVVAFLGEIPDGEVGQHYLDSLKASIHKNYRDTDKMKLIVC